CAQLRPWAEHQQLRVDLAADTHYAGLGQVRVEGDEDTAKLAARDQQAGRLESRLHQRRDRVAVSQAQGSQALAPPRGGMFEFCVGMTDAVRDDRGGIGPRSRVAQQESPDEHRLPFPRVSRLPSARAVREGGGGGGGGASAGRERERAHWPSPAAAASKNRAAMMRSVRKFSRSTSAAGIGVPRRSSTRTSSSTKASESSTTPSVRSLSSSSSASGYRCSSHSRSCSMRPSDGGAVGAVMFDAVSCDAALVDTVLSVTILVLLVGGVAASAGRAAPAA